MTELAVFTNAHKRMPLELCKMIGEYMPIVRALGCDHIWEGIRMYRCGGCITARVPLDDDHAVGYSTVYYPRVDTRLAIQACIVKEVAFYNEYAVVRLHPHGNADQYHLIRLEDRNQFRLLYMITGQTTGLQINMFKDYWSLNHIAYTYLGPYIRWNLDYLPCPEQPICDGKKATIHTTDNRQYTVTLTTHPDAIIDAGSAWTCIHDNALRHVCIRVP